MIEIGLIEMIKMIEIGLIEMIKMIEMMVNMIKKHMVSVIKTDNW